MLLDLDGFKGINDTYGHAAGDEVLYHASDVLSNFFGDECCYRFGGDEFLVVCADTSQEEFMQGIERIRTDFGKIHVNKQMAKVGFSAGYVFGNSEHYTDLRLMFRQADELMNNAKKSEGNHCCGDSFDRAKAQSLKKHGEDSDESLIETV